MRSLERRLGQQRETGMENCLDAGAPLGVAAKGEEDEKAGGWGGEIVYTCSSGCMMLESCWAGRRGARGEQTASPWVAGNLGTAAGRQL